MLKYVKSSVLATVLIASVTPGWGQACLPGQQCVTIGGSPNVATIGIPAPGGTVLTSVGAGASGASRLNAGGDQSTQASTEQAAEAVRRRRVRQTESVEGASAPVAPQRLSAWALGVADYESHGAAVSSQSTNVTRTTSTFGFIGGADIAFRSLASGDDGFLIGALAGYSSSYAHFSSGNPNARLYGPVTGLYASYYLGHFSTDLLLKADFFTLDDPALAQTSDEITQNDYTVAQNFNYRFPWAQYWIEPTMGYRYLNIVYDAGASTGAQGESWRVQGGLRVGRDALVLNGVLVSWSFAALLYDDVALNGFAIDAGGALNSLSPVLPSDLNQLRLLGIATINVDYGDGLSSFLEADARGGDNVIGAGGKIGVRYRW